MTTLDAVNAPTVGKDAAIAAAFTVAQSVAPTFALDRFVAVNPFFGHTHLPFAHVAARMQQTGGSRLTPARDEMRAAFADGRVTAEDLQLALAELDLPATADAAEAIRMTLFAPTEAMPSALPTAAQLVAHGYKRICTQFVVDQLSQFCAGTPLRPVTSGALYAAWHAELAIDRAADAAGLADVRAQLVALPATIEAIVAAAAVELELSAEAFALYLERLLADISGWAAFWRGQAWDSDMNAPGAALDMLAMRLGWDLALLRARPGVKQTLRQAYLNAGQVEATPSLLDAVLQGALEVAWRRQLSARLSTGTAGLQPALARPAMQAVFCIDVRSEPFRRALEAQDNGIETLGFAGFFGLPLSVSHESGHGAAHCPVLIGPTVNATPNRRTSVLGEIGALLSQSAQQPLASLGYVESFGLGYAARHVTASVKAALRGEAAPRRKPATYAVTAQDGSELDIAGRVKLAAGMLTGMGLKSRMAPVIALVGHGASTVNNAHAASLQCGACGGHSGEANAVVAAGLLNDSSVRKGLAVQGIVVPEDTLFVPALHDTTLDRVTLLLDPDERLRSDVELAMTWFARAADNAGPVPARPQLDGSAAARSADWSTQRPEWGLVGCAAFIAGPRAATRGRDLHGETFLHSYDWREDAGFTVLEQILTAPLVVASWINLQYFAATRDNARFGGGNKLLHNVVAGQAVIEGAGGDLRAGLPLQSLHDGEDFVHLPLRLTALIEAPTEAMGEIIARNGHLRDLLENHWISLFQTENGAVKRRYAGGGKWADAML